MCTLLYTLNIYLQILIVQTNLYHITDWNMKAKSVQELDMNLIHMLNHPSLLCNQIMSDNGTIAKIRFQQ
jgi:hypothetical protein